MSKDIEAGLKQLINICAGVVKGDIVLIISDENTRDIGELIKSKAEQITSKVYLEITNSLSAHGKEPPQIIADMMINSTVIFGLTKMSMAHTKARKSATDNGARYLSLPDYSMEILSSPSMLVDFKSLTAKSEQLKSVLSKGKRLTVKTSLGTNIQCDISGRIANASPGWCGIGYEMASPPNAETNIAPLESCSNGIIVVDGSIPFLGIGLLKTPLTIIVEDGSIKSFYGYCARIYEDIFKCSGTSASKILAEIGIGLNPNAKLCGKMLEDEGCLGTLHFGFGSNCTIGGLNSVDFHIDHVINKPTVMIDSQMIINKGVFMF